MCTLHCKCDCEPDCKQHSSVRIASRVKAKFTDGRQTQTFNGDGETHDRLCYENGSHLVGIYRLNHSPCWICYWRYLLTRIFPLWNSTGAVRGPWWPDVLYLRSVALLFNTRTYIQVSQEEWTKLWESVPYVKLYRYNPKHLYPKLNGYGDNGHRKVWASGVGGPRTVRRPWRHTHPLRMPGNETS